MHVLILTQDAGIRYPEKVELRCSIGSNHVVNFRVYPNTGLPCGMPYTYMYG